MITCWMKLGGNLPPGHIALLFSHSLESLDGPHIYIHTDQDPHPANISFRVGTRKTMEEGVIKERKSLVLQLSSMVSSGYFSHRLTEPTKLGHAVFSGYERPQTPHAPLATMEYIGNQVISTSEARPLWSWWLSLPCPCPPAVQVVLL